MSVPTIKSSVKLPRQYILKQDLCASLDITMRAFDHWNVPPVARYQRQNCYMMRDVLEARLAHYRGEDIRDREGVTTKAQADLELTKEKIRNQRLKTDVEEAKYIPIELVEGVFALVASKLGAELDTFYMLIKRKYNNIDPAVIADIDKSSRNCANALSSMDFELERELKLLNEDV